MSERTMSGRTKATGQLHSAHTGWLSDILWALSSADTPRSSCAMTLPQEWRIHGVGPGERQSRRTGQCCPPTHPRTHPSLGSPTRFPRHPPRGTHLAGRIRHGAHQHSSEQTCQCALQAHCPLRAAGHRLQGGNQVPARSSSEGLIAEVKALD